MYNGNKRYEKDHWKQTVNMAFKEGYPSYST